MTVNEGMVEQNNFDDFEPTPFSVMSTVDVRIIQSAAAPSWQAERLAGAPATLDHPRDDSSGVKPCFSLAKLERTAPRFCR